MSRTGTRCRSTGGVGVFGFGFALPADALETPKILDSDSLGPTGQSLRTWLGSWQLALEMPLKARNPRCVHQIFAKLLLGTSCRFQRITL